MARNLILILILALSMAMAGQAWSAPKSSSVKYASRTVRVGVPQSELQKSLASSELETVQSSYSASQFEIQLSSWSPRNFSIPSFSPETSRFAGIGMPTVSVSRVSLVRDTSAGSVSMRLGAGLTALKRDGLLRVGNLQQKSSQSLFLLPIQIGLEFEPSVIFADHLSSYFGAALLPTLAMAPPSSISKGYFKLGFPLQFTSGLSFSPGWMTIAGLPARATAGAIATLGSIAGGNIYGLGFTAGLQISLQ